MATTGGKRSMVFGIKCHVLGIFFSVALFGVATTMF